MGVAFGVEGFLMMSHEKHIPLDKTVHQLLGYTMCMCAASVALELRWPTSLLPALARGYTTLLQGAWLMFIGYVLFGGKSEGPYCCSMSQCINELWPDSFLLKLFMSKRRGSCLEIGLYGFEYARAGVLCLDCCCATGPGCCM